MKWGVRHDYEPVGRHYRNTQQTSQPVKRKGLTDKQKKALKIGAISVGTCLAAYGAYKLTKGGISNNTKAMLGLDAVDSINIKDVKFGVDCVKNINPEKSRTNCGATSICGIINSLGNTKQAVGTLPDELGGAHGLRPDKISDIFEGVSVHDVGDLNMFASKNGTPVTEKAANKICNKLLEYGNGSSGLLWSNIPGASHGHYTQWAVLDGKVHILEGQSASIGGDIPGLGYLCEKTTLDSIHWTNDIRGGILNGSIKYNEELLKKLLK